jgi:ketosteroid isomerase-like protein
MNRTLGPIVCLVALLALGCAEPRDPEADKAAIVRVREQALAALNAGDSGALLAVLDEDIVLMRSEGVTLVGYGPVAEYLKDLFARVQLNVIRQEQKLVLADEWAFDHSRLTGTWTPKGGGEPRPIDARVNDLLKLRWDDTWKYTRLMGLPTLNEETDADFEETTSDKAAGE